MLCWSCSAQCPTHTANGKYSAKENECGRYRSIVTWWKGYFKEVSVDECAAQTGKGTQWRNDNIWSLYNQLGTWELAGQLEMLVTNNRACTLWWSLSWQHHRNPTTQILLLFDCAGLGCGLQDLVPQPTPPLHWECGILANGPPRKSLHKTLFIPLFIL